jgi:hypothetical protein
MHRLDKAGLPGIIAQNLAQFANAIRQHGLGHHRVGPHGSEQRLFRDYLAGMVDQTAQDGKSLIRQG